MHIRASKLIQLSLAGLFASFCGNAFASGFQLFEANGAGTGDFYAGAAASATDASTAYFNPAGLVFLPNQQIVISAVNIFSDVDFTGTNTWSNPNATAAINSQTGLNLPSTFTESGSAQGGGYSLVPGFDYAVPINDSMAFGFSVAVPFGLQTNYSDTDFTRYAATNTSVQVIDISPSLGFKLTDNFGIGAGIDAERLDARINSIGGLPNLSAIGYAPTTFDTVSDNNAWGWGYGWHAGILYQFTPNTRAGLAYHSKVTFSVDGTSSFDGALAGGPSTLVTPNPAGTFENENLNATTTLPATTMLSVFHKFNCAWTAEATAAYTEWSVFNTLNLNNVAAVNAALGPQTINVVVPQGFRNSWRFAAGGSYQPATDWILRAGLGYDQSPTVDQYRNIRLPDGNRFATAIGAHYQATKTLGVDAGWTHLFFQDGDVNVSQTFGSQQSITMGSAKTSADLLGLQLTWDIV